MFQNPTPIVLNLIIINVIVFITGSMLHTSNDFLSLHYVGSAAFNPIQFFTYMFVHANLRHLLGNMLGIFLFGTMLEQYWGSKKFLTYYTICGIAAGMLYSGYVYYEMFVLKQALNSYISHPSAQAFSDFLNKHLHALYLQNFDFLTEFAKDPSNPLYISESIGVAKQIVFLKGNTPMLGASGAVYAVLLGVGLLFPNREFSVFRIKLVFVVLAFGLLSIYGMIEQKPDDHVAHFAHLSGMIVGFVLLTIWGERRANY
jgi:membrane associated rhomboid family serine protease